MKLLMRILVADDSKTSLALVLVVLNKLGHQVITAINGQEAIEKYKRTKPDLVILDVMLEKMDGFECAREIRKIDIDDWIPIIFLSASVDDESIAKGIDAGGDDYLAKPFSEITLVAKIKVMQRISDLRQKLFETTQQFYLLSSTDSLTGVYNRFQFDRSIKEILVAADRYQHKVAMLFIDLDNFKNINDSFGHRIGDQLLTMVSKRLKACLKSSDFIARLGGDEFAVMLSEIQNQEEAAKIAKNIINTISADYILEGQNIRIGASIGIDIYPSSATSAEKLILNSDVAMYHAKVSGKNNYQFFSKILDDKYRQLLSLENSLKFALEKDELYLTYQPIYDLQKMELVGLEALIVWDNPQFGHISPSIFITIAERTGLISTIGRWILDTAFKDYSTWPLNKYKNFKFAINISSFQIINENFIEIVTNLMKEYKIAPNLIEFELTETVIMSYFSEPFKDTIKQLHNDGISISIDDFGTGYSSLIRLKHLPINTLKIETSFVQEAIANPNSAIIVTCLIALGKNLGLNVIAEGIETKEQLDFLIKNGCPQGQGFFLGKPTTAKNISQLLDDDLRKRQKLITER